MNRLCDKYNFFVFKENFLCIRFISENVFMVYMSIFERSIIGTN